MSQESPSTSPAPDSVRTVPVLPTSGIVLPEMVVTIKVESTEAAAAVAAAGSHDDHVVLVPRDVEATQSIGTLARIEQRGALPGGGDGLVIRGVARVRVGRGSLDGSGALLVDATTVEGEDHSDHTGALADRYRAAATRLLDAIGGSRMARLLHDVDDPGALADTIAWWPELSDVQRVRLLETVATDDRLRLAIEWAEAAAAEAEVSGDIHRQVSSEIDATQREAILRRQLSAIQNELGEGDADAAVTYRARLDALREQGVAEPVAEAIDKEIGRLDQAGAQSQESGWIRTWLDTVFEIPWTTRTNDDLDLARARQVLDSDHTGLDDVKERIVEFLAVRRLREERSVDRTRVRGGTILALAGPPGVGKTSLGRSVARTLGREFVRMSLGGIHDEAEIRGHRRTYVGARPGRIVRALTEAGAMNPVVLLDEIDKVGSDYRGDPSAALLEVLDPAQNDSFRDHYLEVDLDLSDVVFIATANEIERLPAPLLDRMEVISLRGYSEDEKVDIARDHLLPRLYEQNAVRPDEVVVSDELVRAVVGDYTREAGVRSLERRLDRLIRRAATRLATRDASSPGDDDPIVVTKEELVDALGRPAPREDPADRTADPGVATGLAVTGAGGDVLFVETAVTPGDDGLTLTGQLGDVMQESAQIALSFLRANAPRLGIELPDDRRVHVHFPAGAVPKDGPSAGVTMSVALVSLLTGRRVRGDVAMTGEVTLQGRVLPIGGVKEKVLAAHRAGVTEVILPIANEGDVDDIPERVRDDVTIHLVTRVDEALEVALAP